MIRRVELSFSFEEKLYFFIMTEEWKVVEDVLARFGRIGLEYMLTGSMAMNYYAIPRMTRDVDLVVELQSSHLSAFFGEFSLRG